MMTNQKLASDLKIKAGFTLVELLVVIGIIALLISILLPALNKARAAANETVCASNLRQLGIATQMYINDNAYYPGAYTTTGTGNYAVWPARLRKYVKNQKLYKCPSQIGDFSWEDGGPPSAPIANIANGDTGYGYNPGEHVLLASLPTFTYGYNDWGAGQTPNNGPISEDVPTAGTLQLGLGGDVNPPATGTTNHELKASRVWKPAEMIEITDIDPFLGTPHLGYNYNVDPNDPSQCPSKIHHGGSNVLYCDGHVIWKAQGDLVLFFTINGRQTFPPASYVSYAKNCPQWNNDNKVHHYLSNQ
ncbi:MAG TPA: prepilin-type N-terminal cleavage/methylation domain-containing protein [Tepidisphaeraceae bacterium]